MYKHTLTTNICAKAFANNNYYDNWENSIYQHNGKGNQIHSTHCHTDDVLLHEQDEQTKQFILNNSLIILVPFSYLVIGFDNFYIDINIIFIVSYNTIPAILGG